MSDHWLVTALRRGGVAGADRLRITPGLTVARAWREAAAALDTAEGALAGAVAKHFRLGVADLASIHESALKLLPASVVRQYHVLPLRQTDRELVVATSDPANLDLEQTLGFASGRQPVFEVAPPTALLEAIETRYPEDRPAAEILKRLEPKQAEDGDVVDRLAGDIEAARGGKTAAAVRLTNVILRTAATEGASRMELRPGDGGGRISLWVGGVERHMMQMPAAALASVVSRLGMLVHIGSLHRTRRQTGSTRIQVSGKSYDVSVVIQRQDNAHRAVVKFSDAAPAGPLSQLGLTDDALSRIENLLSAQSGLVVISGPPASGKTTLLASMAAKVAATRPTALVTETVERAVPNVTNYRPEPARGIDAVQALEGATAARATALFVDMPPESAILGRLHDAATDGRLVVMTVEASDPVTGLEQLAERGLGGPELAGILRGVSVQGLMRRLCPSCATAVAVPTAEETRLSGQLGVAPVRRPVGCAACGESGYAGLVIAVDVATANEELATRLRQRAFHDLRPALASAGGRGLAGAAADQIAAGASTLDEMDRLLRSTEDRKPLPRVLVADDDPETVLLARTVLENAGFEVADAPDGDDALARIEAEPFALVILDLNMPRLDGRDVLKRLKGRVATAGIPVVVLTGSDSVDDEVLVMEEGAADYIRKPIDPPRFIARVRAALRRASAG